MRKRESCGSSKKEISISTTDVFHELGKILNICTQVCVWHVCGCAGMCMWVRGRGRNCGHTRIRLPQNLTQHAASFLFLSDRSCKIYVGAGKEIQKLKLYRGGWKLLKLISVRVQKKIQRNDFSGCGREHGCGHGRGRGWVAGVGVALGWSHLRLLSYNQICHVTRMKWVMSRMWNTSCDAYEIGHVTHVKQVVSRTRNESCHAYEIGHVTHMKGRVSSVSHSLMLCICILYIHINTHTHVYIYVYIYIYIMYIYMYIYVYIQSYNSHEEALVVCLVQRHIMYIQIVYIYICTYWCIYMYIYSPITRMKRCVTSVLYSVIWREIAHLSLSLCLSVSLSSKE